MFFILSRILSFLLAPYLWIIALLIVSLVVKGKKWKKRNLLTALVSVFLFSNAFIYQEFLRLWEMPPTLSKNLAEDYDYGIILGGMAGYDRLYSRISFHEGVDRLLQALDLYKSNKIKRLVIVGGAGSLVDNDISESAVLQQYLIRLGIPPEDILIEPDSRNTRENAVKTTALLVKGNASTIRSLLFTSALHMRRAQACFAKAGLKVMPYATNLSPSERKYYPDNLFLPSASILGSWELLIKEIFGYGIYKLMGYV